MGKIQSIQPSNRQTLGANKNSAQITQPPNFKGAGGEAVQALTKSQELLVDKALTTKYLGKTGKALNFLSDTAGEIQNLWVMNIGTAFIAPVIIATNPITKEDQKSKEYTAWRQPISAVIALAFGLGVNIPIPKYIEKKVVEGKFEKFDLSMKPPSDFLRQRYKGIQKHFDNLKGSDKEYFDLINDGKVSNIENFKTKFASYQEFENAVHKVTLNLAAKKLLDKNNPNSLHNQTMKDFLIKNLKFENDYIDNTALNSESTVKKLSSTKAMDFLKAFGFSESEVTENTLRTFINNNFYKDRVKFSPMERKLITRIGENLIPEEIKNSETITLKTLFKVLNIDEGFAENKKLLNMNVTEFLPWLNKNMNIQAAVMAANPSKVKVKIPTVGAKESLDFLEKHAAQIAKNIASKAASNYGAYKKIQGIVLTLATLPFSCGLLNWAYPRIMEKYFPQLIKKSETQTSSKGGK